MTTPYLERLPRGCDCDACRDGLPLEWWSAPLEPARAVVDVATTDVV